MAEPAPNRDLHPIGTTPKRVWRVVRQEVLNPVFKKAPQMVETGMTSLIAVFEKLAD